MKYGEVRILKRGERLGDLKESTQIVGENNGNDGVPDPVQEPLTSTED